METAFLEQFKPLVLAACESQDCRLYDLEVGKSGSQKVLRVYIDVVKKMSAIADGTAEATTKNLVSLNQCVEVSRDLNKLMEEKSIDLEGAYNLEVSSPGVERHLRNLWHYEEALGESLKIKTIHRVEDLSKKTKLQKVVKGILKSITDNKILIEKGNKSWSIDLENIQKATVIKF